MSLVSDVDKHNAKGCLEYAKFMISLAHDFKNNIQVPYLLQLIDWEIKRINT